MRSTVFFYSSGTIESPVRLAGGSTPYEGLWKFSMKGDGERCATMDLMQPQQKSFVTALDIQGIELHIYKKTLINYSN